MSKIQIYSDLSCCQVSACTQKTISDQREWSYDSEPACVGYKSKTPTRHSKTIVSSIVDFVLRVKIYALGQQYYIKFVTLWPKTEKRVASDWKTQIRRQTYIRRKRNYYLIISHVLIYSCLLEKMIFVPAAFAIKDGFSIWLVYCQFAAMMIGLKFFVICG